MQVGVLGPVQARLGGVEVDLGTRKQRALVAALVLHGGRPVGADTLVHLLWGDDPPAAVTPTLHGYVARLRRALEPSRPPRAPSTVLVTVGDGYALRVPDEALDVSAFEEVVRRAHGSLPPGLVPDPGAQEAEELLGDLDAALGSWRGTPYADLADSAAVVAERTRLEELRLVALEDRAVLGLARGRHATVAAELEALVSAYPLRERLWGLRAVALTRAGRQADALEVLREVRALLADELGIEPGQELRDLQTAVLRQDPCLAYRGEARAPEPTGSVRDGASAEAGPITAPAQALPLVGREAQLEALDEAWERSSRGPEFVVVTGEAGIGKTRLCAELVERARGQGATVLLGRCSQDEGAPSLYAWTAVLSGLGLDLGAVAGESDLDADSGSRFRAWERIARAVLDAASERHVLVVLDDLHWADASTLRVLRLLAETATMGRLLVVATWRPEPAPTGQLAVVADMLARRHARRLELAGLSTGETADLAAAVARTDLTAAEATALRERTDGNPFFLVEYARLAGAGGDLATLLAEEHPPAAVNEVLGRRLESLPESSARTLRAASVLGRTFELDALSAVLGSTEDAVLADLEVALEAGLVREPGVDRFSFAHALVRDAAYAAISRSRRGRAHVRAAEVLTAAGDRESQVARHWLAAGPAYAEQAWRAARVAARSAREVHGEDEARELLRHALRAMDEHGAVDDDDRLAVLFDLAAAQLALDDRTGMRVSVREAAVVAHRSHAPTRWLPAVRLLTTRPMWQAGGYGEIDDVVVGALRELLDVLPDDDAADRSLAMVALAQEITTTTGIAEREALCEQAVAMARRLGDPELLMRVLIAVPIGIWRPGTADLRRELADEAAELARALGCREELAVALALSATGQAESGHVVGLFAQIDRAREIARAERLFFVQLFLDGVEVSWRGMRGEVERTRALMAEMASIHERIDVPQTTDAVLGAVLMDLWWNGTAEDLAPYLDAVRQVVVLPPQSLVACLLGRLGRTEECRDLLLSSRLELSADYWFSGEVLATLAEAALAAGLPDLASRAYEALAPYAGRPAAAGSGSIVGPIDLFLAMAAQATGEHALASRHADAAVRLCEQWQVPQALAWCHRVRAEHGF